MCEGMRVLVVSGSFPLSAKQVRYSFVFDEALRVSKRGVSVHVARGIMSILNERRDMVIEGMYIHNFSRKIDASIISVSAKNLAILPPKVLFYPRAIFATLPYSWFITKLMRTYEVDFVHAHIAYPNGFVALIAKHKARKPLIVTLHGSDILTDPSVSYGMRLDQTIDMIIRKVLKEADVVIAASTATYREALRAGCQSEKIMLIPNGVDLDRFNSKINGRRIRNVLSVVDKPMVFALGAHVPEHGFEYLIEAAYSVLKERPDVFFVIGGDGPLRPWYEEKAKSLGIDKNVIFVGKIPPEDLPCYYAASDLFVIPSLVEAFGLVIVEAMGCEKPVVGTKVGGIPDIIKDGLNGYLARPRDSKSLAEKILFLLENPNIAKRMGKEGRRLAQENFDIEKRINKILTIYSELTERQ